MNLTRRQRKYINKYLNTKSLEEIAKELNLSLDKVQEYVRQNKKWEFEKKTNSQTGDSNIVLTNRVEFIKQIVRKNIFSLILLTILVIVAYINGLNSAFVSDDIGIITKDPKIGEFAHAFTTPAAFLRSLIYFGVYKVGGLNPLFFRLVNVLFHMANVWLVFIILAIFTVPVHAFLATIIFAVHPIIVESITWISGGIYPQYSFFLLGAFLTYWLSAQNSKYYFVSLFLFTLSLFSADRGAMLPFILILYEFCFGSIKKNWKKLIPYFIITFFFGLLIVSRFTERVGAQRQIYYQGGGLDNPLLQIPTAISSYLYLLFWPDKLSLYQSELTFTPFEFAIRALVTLSFFGYVIYLFFKKNWKLFFWSAFFVITLLPTLTPFRISWTVAERYVYLGSIGIIFIFTYYLNKLAQNKKWQPIVYTLFTIVVVALMIRTIIRNADWKSEDSLYVSTGRTAPSDPKTHNNLGDVYSRANNLEKSEIEFKKAIELNPGYADAYHNLANTYWKMNRLGDALAAYQKASEINPNLWQSHQNIAAITYEMGNYKVAQEHMEKAIGINSKEPSLYVNLGLIYLKTKSKEEAVIQMQKALRLDPTFGPAQKALNDIQALGAPSQPTPSK